MKNAILLILLSSFLAGCIYADVQRPLGTEFNKTELGSKVGESSNKSLLWLVAWGDAGTKSAATNGNITVIRHADVRIFSVLFGLYSQSTTIVYGD